MSSELGLTDQEKIKELETLKRRLALKEGLPFHPLFGPKMYEWQHDFFHTWNKTMLLTAGNQLGKSTIQIRKYINLATDPSLWGDLWPDKKNDKHFAPTIWYLYPNQVTATQEFFDKWVAEWMPRGEFIEHEQYGWKKVVRHGIIVSVEFATGAKIYFKAYSQNEADLQASTVSAIACDEELPEGLFPELTARLFGSDGYFSMVFTATLGQSFWRRAMEPRKNETETLVGAWKRRASAYDSMVYVDGTPSKWDETRIKANIAKCSSEAEVKKRIFGHFVKDEGTAYTGFSRERNYVPYPSVKGREYRGVPKGWDVISGVDYGSGGDNHPSAFCFIAINPDRTKLRLFRGRRLDDIGSTTSADLLRHYLESRGKLEVMCQAYDHAAKDFGTLAERAGEYFVKANKDRTYGKDLLNTLLKFGIFKIYQCEEHDKLVEEFETLSELTVKNHAEDDFIDCVRYAIASAPMDWATIIERLIKEGKVDTNIVDKVEAQTIPSLREENFRAMKKREERGEDTYKLYENEEASSEFSYWNGLY